MGEGITNLDLIIIAGYFLFVVLIGIWVGRTTKTGEDLFLGGRSFGWGLIGLSLFASNISSSTIIGLSGAAYSTGIVQSVFEWMSGIPLIIAALVFVPLYLKTRITTIPEFLERRYDRRSQVFFSLVTIVISIIVDTAGGLYAGAIVLQTFFPDLILWQTCLVLAFIAGVYTAFGGLKAVVYTDAIQAIILILGCGIMTFMLFERLDFSWETIVNSAPEGHFSIVRPLDDESLPWPGLILGVPILGFWYWSTNQYIVQRILGGKNIAHARWGVILAGFLKVIPLLIMVIPGAMAISLFPGLDNPDTIFATIVIDVLPAGLVGLVLAGLISAIMSSVDSTLNSASTLLIIDFVKPLNPNISPQKTAYYGRVATLVLMIIAALWAPQIENFGGLWAYLQQMFAIVVPPIAAIFLLGVFYKKGTANASFLTLIIGSILGAGIFILSRFDMWDIHFTINVGIMLGVSCLIYFLVSHLDKQAQPEDVEDYLFKKSYIGEGMENVPLYADYRLHMVLLLILIGSIFILLF